MTEEFGFEEATAYIKEQESRSLGQKVDDAVDRAAQKAREDGGRRWLTVGEGTRIIEGAFKIKYAAPTDSPLYNAMGRGTLESQDPIEGSVSRRIDPEDLKEYLRQFTPRKEKA